MADNLRTAYTDTQFTTTTSVWQFVFV